jgi:hypothetical protein
MAAPRETAKRERVSSIAGAGCAIQALGLLCPAVLWAMFGVGGAAIGLIPMIALFLVGSAKAMSWRCGSCKNPIASKEVSVCPTCRAELRQAQF